MLPATDGRVLVQAIDVQPGMRHADRGVVVVVEQWHDRALLGPTVLIEFSDGSTVVEQWDTDVPIVPLRTS